MILNGIQKAYNGRTVLAGIRAYIPENGVCAVLGPSGCGKTTLLRIILGLEQPDAGSIADLPAGCAVMFQEDRLFPALNLQKNLKMAVPGMDRRKADELIRMLGLADCGKKPVRDFSGGMARRAALVRALLAPGGLVVLDEPFAGLDEDNRAAAARAITGCTKDRILIYTAHDAPEPLLPRPDCILDLTMR